MEDKLDETFDAVFTPESIAIIGASNDEGKLGWSDLRRLVEFGYTGDIYPINPKETEVQGFKAYKSVLDVPEKIDRAAIIVPTKHVSASVKECAQKGVKVVQIYSAGFGEFGEDGKQVELEMLESAGTYGMRIVGPNCIGTYCPQGRITFTNDVSMVPGHVSFISQSGGISFDIVNRGELLGVNFSKVISVGNCIDLTHSDYLEFLKNDEQTKVVGFYIESVKDGQRFMELLKETTKIKPVVILKGGRTDSGSASVASHTGNIAGNYEVWEAMFRQTGAIPVKSINEMLTVLTCLQTLKPYYAGKLAMVGNGGGATVLATDYLEEVQLKLATGNADTISKLNNLNIVGKGEVIHPIDLPAHQLAVNNGRLFGDIIRAFVADEEIKHVLFHLNLTPFSSYFNVEEVLDNFSKQLLSIDLDTTNLVGVFRSNEKPEIEEKRYKAAQKLRNRGIPIFRTIEEAAYGISVISQAV